MATECIPNQLNLHGIKPLEFSNCCQRKVIAKFDGNHISTNGGVLLLTEIENRTHVVQRLSQCFTDYRNPELIEHSVKELLLQRIYGLALGYEDLNDHDQLRHDPLLAVAVGKQDPTGNDRSADRDKGKALAGKSTLNRLELTPADAIQGPKKILADHDAMDDLLVDLFLDSYGRRPKRIWLDVDATDDQIHGMQEGRFYHGYYRHYCYLPLYIFAGDHLLCARLRQSDIDGAAGAVDELDRIVKRIRRRWPKVKIYIRGDSGFCRDELMNWCERDKHRYVLGLAKNNRLKEAISQQMGQAKTAYQETETSARVFKDFRYQTRKSWRRKRRVVGKAEHMAKGENPRFVVTNIPKSEVNGRDLYEKLYCARGDMENRIKEQQLSLFADRTSTTKMRSNQLRLYFSSFAYVLMCALRRIGLSGTEMARAQCGTIRLKLLKLGAQTKITVRKVWISLSESYPYAQLFRRVFDNIEAYPLLI